MKNDQKFFCVNAWGCATDYRTHLAFELIRNYGLVSAMPDADGKPLKLVTPEEIVGRAFALVDEWARVAMSRGEFGLLSQPTEEKEPEKQKTQ
jgi:hypothetical protein